ncbi:MAG: trimethylamine methyltransferase, partial [Chromatiales bacterium]|nr:trimethylamine methyltransferase [Chromatiales bacterium]
MNEPTQRRRRGQGREARRAARSRPATEQVAYITRKTPIYNVLDEEGLSLIESNADTILEEIGIEFREYPRALELFAAAGADIDGERVHFPRGLCRSIIQASAPREFIQCARNRERDVKIGGDAMVMVPA